MTRRSSPICRETCLTTECGSLRNSSSKPSSCIISSVEGCTVSPRKSRRKSACFSRTVTETPARASRKPSIIPAGPPPTMQQVVFTEGTDLISALPNKDKNRALAWFHPHAFFTPACLAFSLTAHRDNRSLQSGTTDENLAERRNRNRACPPPSEKGRQLSRARAHPHRHGRWRRRRRRRIPPRSRGYCCGLRFPSPSNRVRR